MSRHIVTLTRRFTFSASHRLHSDALSDSENKKVFGKCNYPNGHGHNYTVEVTLRGPVDSRTGMMFDLFHLKAVLGEIIDRDFDHKNLNLDVPEFKDLIPTGENLCLVLWNRFRSQISPTLLFEVRVIETENNSFSYRGESEPS